MQQLDKGGEPSVRNCQTSFQPSQAVINTVHLFRYIHHSVPFYHQTSTFIVIRRLSCSFGFITHRIRSCFIRL